MEKLNWIGSEILTYTHKKVTMLQGGIGLRITLVPNVHSLAQNFVQAFQPMILNCKISNFVFHH